MHQHAPVKVRPARPEARQRLATRSHPILELQRLVGNQAVAHLLLAQRAPTAVLDKPTTAPATGPLSPAQLQRAKNFYAAQPGRYTPAIISQIQAAVGTEPTGKISDADVQAVAKKQEQLNINASPALKIDGMAGPRTLPQVFKFGLANDADVADYTKKARARFGSPNGKSEREIAREIVESEILPRMATQGIPPFKFNIVNDLGTRGAFSNSDWELKLDDLQFQPGDKHDLKDTTATIYHESRHAEQDFRIGQMLAGRGRTPQQINNETGLKLEIAEKAKEKPLAPGSMEALIADEWNESLNSPAALEKRRRNNAELKAAFRAREAARKANKEHPSKANAARQAAAEARFDTAVAEHDDLPFEFDAERLESKVRDQF